MSAKSVTIRLDSATARRVEWAARREKVSSSAFLEQTAEQAFEQALIHEAADRFRRGDFSLSTWRRKRVWQWKRSRSW